jgi:tetratricopeptide (TPR) repeat protein
MHHALPYPFRSLAAVVAGTLATLVITGCSSRSRVAGHLAEADRAYAAGRYDEAEIEYKNVLQLDGLNAPAIARLGLILYDEGREARAFPFLLKTKELQPDNLDARLRLGLAYLAGGSPDDARKEALFILLAHPADLEAPLLLVDAAGVTPAEIADARQRLLRLPPGAPALVALGALELREGKIEDAEAIFRHAGEVDPNSPEVALALGMLRWSQNDLPSADAALQRAAEQSVDRSPRRLKYAQFKIQTGDLAGGKKLLEAMSRKTPDYVAIWVWLAEVAAAEKNFGECDRLLARVFARDPLHPDAMMLDARVHLAKGEPVKAIAELEKLIAIFPKSPLIAYQLGMAYAANNESVKALSRLAQAIAAAPGMSHAILAQAEINISRRDFGAAVAPLQQLVRSRPDIPLARAVLAEALRGLGNLDEAATLYRQLEEQFPQDPQTPFWRGMVLVQQGKPDEARKSFARALELSPASLPALDQLTDLDLRAKNFSEARQRLEKEIAAQPKRADLSVLLSKILLAQGDRPAAETALKNAVELAPESPAGLLALARMQASGGQNETALPTLQKLAAQFPKLGGVSSMIGVIYDGLGNYPAARAAYEKALTADPKDGVALNNLAFLEAERFDQLDKALELAQRARTLAPQEPRTADTLGWILVAKKQYSQALPLLQESAGRLPEEAEVHFHVGVTLYMLGDEAPARAALQRAMTLNAHFPGVDEARRRLQLLDIAPVKAGSEEKQLLEKRIVALPIDPVAQVRLADIYLRDGEASKALVAYEAALLANPRNAHALVMLAQIRADKKDFPKAIEAAKGARTLAPNDPAIAQTLGRLVFRAGDRRWAAGLFHEAVTQMPENPEAWFDWSEAAYSVGEVKEAATAARQALALSATFPRAKEAGQFLALVACAEDSDRARAGLAQAEEALKSDPGSVPALMVVAAAHNEPGGSAAVQRAYEQILERYPDFSPARKNLLIAYATNPANDAKAIALATKARLAFPRDADLARAIGIVAYRQGDFARAANLLQESAAQLGKDGEVMYYLGMAQWRLNKRNEGRQSLQRALELGVNDTHAAEARKSLASLE